MTGREEHRRKLYQSLAEDSAGLMPIDGVMSYQTKQLARSFGATSVDMYHWWARTPPRWACPACGRRKSEIVRRSANGALLCKLVEHHDHMKNYLIERFRHHSSTMEHSSADKLAESFAERSAAMISAYENTIVCDDCNTADVDAKRIAGAHRSFSFSPAELKRIVFPQANAPHRINGSVAKAIWEEGKETFDLRLLEADRIARIAATNRHWFQPIEPKFHPENIKRHSYQVNREVWGPTVSELCGRVWDAPQPRRSGAFDSWRRKDHPRSRRSPTQGELSHLSRVDCAADWQRVGEDWICPGCNRAKFETVRLNGRRTYFFALNTSTERSREAPHRYLLMCKDCGLAAQEMGCEVLQRLGIGGNEYAHHVRLSEIQRVVIAHPHSRHRIDNDAAEKVVIEIMSRLRADRSRNDLLEQAEYEVQDPTVDDDRSDHWITFV